MFYSILKKVLFIGLLPLSLLYAAITALRNFLYDHQWFRSTTFDTPTIVIGNITVGGTGKTPHTEYLYRLLSKHGFRVAILSRGYGRKTKGFLIVEASSTVEEVGDEPLQMKIRFPEALVAVNSNRCQGIESLEQQADPPDVILLDDAFQHRRLKAGYYILLVDSQRPLFKDFTFPSGRLRELASGAKRADSIVISKYFSNLPPDYAFWKKKLRVNPSQGLFFSSFAYQVPQSLFSKDKLSIEELRKKQIILLSGIANPKPLEDYLTLQQVRFKSIHFKDHHNFSLDDFVLLQKSFEDHQAQVVLTTEKDGTRILADKRFPKHLKACTYVLPIEVSFVDKQDQFDSQILNYIRKAKTPTV